ncbi:hypothetical protein C0Q70_07434 [Pomacea canaliculata]|uniref:Uncharacterized protein n=1 Tax=Pomacea canaliculata TaxID=400727 RepID=A0A2T7PF14_POMCA|nr:hypothetical protein C0Q70_07434 [Pomacea canaliculata]
MPLILHPGSAPCHLVCRKIQIFKPKFRSDRQMTRPIHAISGAVASLTRRDYLRKKLTCVPWREGCLRGTPSGKDVSKVEDLFAIQKNVGARTAWSVATSRTDPADDERHFDLALITPCPHQSTPVTISARRRARPNDRTDGGVGCASPEACRATAHFRFPPSEEVSPRHPAPQSPSRV